MRSRAEIYRTFVERFAVQSISSPASGRAPSATELDTVEQALNARFPASYRQFVQRYGCVWTPHLDDHLESAGRLVERGIEAFTPVDEMIASDQWNASIPQPLLLFASDALGDMIGFPKTSEMTDDLPVMLFDHEFNELTELANSFDSLLSAYLACGTVGT